jgi:hypothetical protein
MADTKMKFRILARDDRAMGSRRSHPSTSTALISSKWKEPHRGLTHLRILPRYVLTVAKLRKLSPDLSSFGLECIDLSQEGASGRARGVGVGVLFNRSYHPLPINTVAIRFFLRPAKRPDVRTLLRDCLDNASLLHAASFLCR